MNKQSVTTAIRFFPEHELACKGSGIIKMDPEFAEELPLLREAWGSALIPNSVCRTPEHNANLKPNPGHPNSLHLTENPKHKTLGTCAADISWLGWSVPERLRFARLAWSRGWSVGLHNRFCHIDRRGVAGLAQHCFLYGSWSGQFTPQDVMR